MNQTLPTPFAWRHAGALMLLAAGLALAGCGDRPSDPPPGAAGTASAAKAPAAAQTGKDAQAAAAVADPLDVTVDPELAKRITVGAVSTKKLADTIRVAGRLDVNQYRTARIGAPITGRITHIDVVIGQQVRAGQVLAEISSPELAQAQLAFLRAHSQQQLMTRAVERAQLLLASDVIAAAELQRRQSELTVASAEKRAASDQLRALGISAERVARLEQTGQLQQNAAITSAQAGTIIERKVAQGQVVNPADALFVVSDLTALWAAAEVPEQDAQFVKPGQRVQVEVPALDNERFAGKVAFVSDIVNPDTRTVRVGVDLENRALRFKPSMLITMLVEGRVAERQALPSTAVVRENNVDHVFVERAPGTFRLTPVELGAEREGVRPLGKPLAEGARVVLDGAFHLNNARVQRALSGK